MGTGGSSLPSSPLWLYILPKAVYIRFYVPRFFSKPLEQSPFTKIYNYIANFTIFKKFLHITLFWARRNYRFFFIQCKDFIVKAFLSYQWDQAKRPISIGQLIHCCIYTSDLSTLLSARGLQGYLILKRVSRLDAFSVYLNRTPLPCYAAGATTGAQLVRSSRSSRTKDKPSQVSYAHDG